VVTFIPPCDAEWYHGHMSGTYPIAMGDRGRIVIPAEVRERAGLVEGTPLVLVETPEGIALLTRAQLLDRVRRELDGADLVTALLADRRRSAEEEDRA
jgi:AbrB family looped-hinge helix DNA binding protein